MGIYKRRDLSDLIDAVNAVITNPPDNCTASSELTKPVGPVILKVNSDLYSTWKAIRDIIDNYASTNNTDDSPCGPLTWEHPPTLDGKTIWKQTTIDEINSNLAIIAACTCGCSDEAKATCRSDDGSIIAIRTLTGTTYCSCGGSGDTPPSNSLNTSEATNAGLQLNTIWPTKLIGLINNLNVSPSGCSGRTWTFESSVTQFGSTVNHILAAGSISCEGNIIYSASATTGIPSGMSIDTTLGAFEGGCDGCDNEGALAFAANTGSLSYFIRIHSAGATCQKCS